MQTLWLCWQLLWGLAFLRWLLLKIWQALVLHRSPWLGCITSKWAELDGPLSSFFEVRVITRR